MVTASIVSHGHGIMVCSLVEDLLGCPEVACVVITQNIPEQATYPKDPRVETVRNAKPQGYGANQNTAFASASSPFFCVLNPDIRLKGNPFPQLLKAFNDPSVALVAPKIISPDGSKEDSARKFPTARDLLSKAFGRYDGTYFEKPENGLTYPDWLAGMFLFLRSNAFRKVGGFDERFFLYYEDVDLCWRLHLDGFQVVQDCSVSVVHDARRESHRNVKFARWHLASMARYLIKTRAWW
jgi:N-acetylglucosaminyl-diphospho-decaprenol L-rhamnosyltransferase